MVTQEELEKAFADTNDNYVVIDEVFYFRMPDGRFWCPSRQSRGIKYKYVEPTWADENHEICNDDAKDFTVLEVETTELNKKQYPCQIGVTVVHDGKIEESFCELVKTPGNKYGASKTKRYGITSTMTSNARSFRQIWEEIVVHVDGQMIVSFNGAETLMALHNALKKYDIEEPEIIGYFSIANNKERNLHKLLGMYGISESINTDCGILSKIMANIYLSDTTFDSNSFELPADNDACERIKLLLDKAEKERKSNPLDMFAIKQDSFVAVDFEKIATTQTSICEIGMVKFLNGKEIGHFHSYIRPIKYYVRTPWALENLKHISDADISNAPTFAELHSEIKDFIGDNLLVCHNLGADINYIYNLEKEQNVYNTYHNGFVDTMEIGKKLASISSLDMLYYGIFKNMMKNHHQALDDARACAEIYAKLSILPDIENFIHHEVYIPAAEKEISVNHYATRNISTAGLYDEIEDSIIENYDFRGKSFVISGESVYRERIVEKLTALGALSKSSLSSKTDVFIISDNAGPSKIEKAKEIKKNRTDNFHIFTHEGIAKMFQL